MMRVIPLLFHDVYTADPAESGFRSDAADRYKLTLGAFDAQLAGVAAVRLDAPILIAGGEGGGQTGLPRARAEAPPPFLVTVDDGGLSYHTSIADRLEARGWRGHCFVSTDFIGTRGFLDAVRLRELDARGHVIGSHSASHPSRFSALPNDRMVAEWAQSRRVLEDILGHAVRVGSVPGGYFSPAVARAAAEAGIEVLFTSEPVTTLHRDGGCLLVGRFTIRRGHDPELAQRLVGSAPWTRAAAWASWNAKGLVKPILGPSYMRVAEWLHAARRPAAPGLS
jgi:peptidoglycan/xylan/chitin deacetylase (PgdA/CDA1 family)